MTFDPLRDLASDRPLSTVVGERVEASISEEERAPFADLAAAGAD
jgi:hypothetical protein